VVIVGRTLPSRLVKAIGGLTTGRVVGLEGPDIKSAFQGDEPLLRVDLLETVRDLCREKFSQSRFVVCTNLRELDTRAWAFLDADDAFIRTSLEEGRMTHERQRTHDDNVTGAFLRNIGVTV
jgi:sulfatase maturation enzyme AslB (radical SAM superfamily)